MPNLRKALERQDKNKKDRYGMRGSGAGADRRPVAVRTDQGLPKRLLRGKA